MSILPSPFRRPAPVGLALAGLCLAGCIHQATADLPEGAETLDDLPEGESWDAELRLSEGERMQLALSAPYLARYAGDSAHVYLGPDPALPDSSQQPVSVRLYGDDGALTATIRSTAARYDERTEELTAEGQVRADVSTGSGASITAARLVASPSGAFTASGGATADLREAQANVRAQRISGSEGGDRYEASGRVVVTTRSGRRLDAGRVIWDEGAGRFLAPGTFTFDGPGQRVRGVGLSASADLSRYSFRNGSGTIEVQE